jgi:hypothetical protein
VKPTQLKERASTWEDNPNTPAITLMMRTLMKRSHQLISGPDTTTLAVINPLKALQVLFYSFGVAS